MHKLPEVIFSEEYQVTYLEENNKAMDSCDFVAGEHIWAFADFMTSFGLRRIDGNKKGIFTNLIRKPRPFRGDFVMWLEIILIIQPLHPDVDLGCHHRQHKFHTLLYDQNCLEHR